MHHQLPQNVGRRWLSSWPDRQAAFAVLYGGWPCILLQPRDSRLPVLPCRVLALAPTDVASLSNRGYAFRKLSAYQKAAADYSMALQLSPGTVRLPGVAAAPA